MSDVITGALAAVLEARRDRYNALFAEARQRRPRLAPAAFADVLRVTVAPLAAAVAAAAPERLTPAVDALYELALDLTGQDLLGPGARNPHLVNGWGTLLPGLARFVAEAPRGVGGAISNALYNLAATPGARPAEWSGLMLRLAEVSPDAAALLTAGQVAAWRAGMAHYRAGALAVSRTLPPTLVRVALGLPAAPDPVEKLIEALAADPWLDLAQRHVPPSARQLRVVARVGAFRGFGGEFLRPPIVEAAGEHLLVSDGEAAWLLVADRFGATLHRRTGVSTTALRAPFALAKDGTVKAEGQSVRFAELAGATSHAATPHTLAVTTALSHAVTLVARSA